MTNKCEAPWIKHYADTIWTTDVCKIEYKCADTVKFFKELKIVLYYCSINNFSILRTFEIGLLSLRTDFLIESGTKNKA